MKANSQRPVDRRPGRSGSTAGAQVAPRRVDVCHRFTYAFPPRRRVRRQFAFHSVHSPYGNYGGFETKNQQVSSGDKERTVRLTCQPSTLGQALQTVSRAISTRTTLPILNNILLETTSEGLALTATNLEIGIRKLVPAEVAEEGSTTAPARLLTDFVGSLPDDSLEMSLDTATQTLS